MARAVVFAYHDVGVRCLSVLLAHGLQVPLVVTHRDDPREHVWFASVERLARDHGLEVAAPDDPNQPEFVERVAQAGPDFLFSFYYRQMLSPALLAAARRGAFNMHGSLLPRFRGRAPVNWAVLKGERETGATLHEMVEKPDAGRIVDQMAVPILPDDLAVDVFRKVTVAAEIVLDRSLPAIVAGRAEMKPQDLSKGSYYGGRKPEDGRIDWSRGADEVHDLVRAVAPPFPGAFSDLRGRRLRILRTRHAGRHADGRPVIVRHGPDLFVHCAGGGSLQVLAADLDGARLDAQSFTTHFGTGPVPLQEPA